MTKEEKILALTRNELVFLIDSPEWLTDTAEFFAKGGFNSMSELELERHYRTAIDEGVEP